jgi:hypothetical protein
MAALINWTVAQVDVVGFSIWPSLSFSPSGKLAIAFFARPGVLRFAELNSSGSWIVSTVDSNVGQSCCLKFRLDQPTISYYSGDSPKFAILRGSPPWDIVQVAQLSERPTGDIRLALDPTEEHRPGHVPIPKFRPTISIHNNPQGLAYFQAGSNISVWTGSIVDNKAGVFNSLAFSPSSQLPGIAYSATAENDQEVIKYASFDGAHWKRELVGSGRGWCSLAYTPSGQPAISYMEGEYPHYSVTYAEYTGANWNVQTVAAPADSPWLAFASSGEPVVSYHDMSADAIKYAVFSDHWTHYEVEKAGKDQAGVMHGDFKLTSLAFNPANGQPAIAYYDHEQGAVRCAVARIIRPVPLG